MRRILKSMTQAAKRGELYHLWWHPYNLAGNPMQNMLALEKVINHYLELNRKYGMISLNMEEVSDFVQINND